MTHSESIKSLAAALCKFQSTVGKIGKDATNPHFKNRYASLAGILEAIAAPLADAGLAVAQFPEADNGLTTLLMHAESGEYISATYQMRPVKDDPQGRGSALTYQRRYALSAVLGLCIDDGDDDGNVTSGHGQKQATTGRSGSTTQTTTPPPPPPAIPADWKGAIDALAAEELNDFFQKNRETLTAKDEASTAIAKYFVNHARRYDYFFNVNSERFEPKPKSA